MSGEQPSDPYTHWRRRAETAEARIADLEAKLIRREAEFLARVDELEIETHRLNMEMEAYRQKLTPKDVEAMTAVIKALNAEKAARSTPKPQGNEP